MKTFKYRPTSEVLTAITKLAAQKGQTEEALITQLFTDAARTILSRRNSDLSIKDAACELTVHPETVRRYLRQGKFPNSYQLNSRVIRIPQADLVQLREDRKLSIA